jgi:hypothetical protein
MSEEGKPQSNEIKPVSARQVGFYFTLLVFLAPAFILIWWFPPDYPSFQIWSMVWWFDYRIDLDVWYLNLDYPFFAIGQSIMYTFLRPVFAYQMVRLYQGKSDKKQTLLVGLFTELQMLIIDVPAMLILHSGSFYIFHLPIPLLFLTAVLMVRFVPPRPRDISWVEKEEESSKWWNSENDHEPKTQLSKVRAQLLSVATLNKVLGTILAAEIILIIIGGLIVIILDSWPMRYYYGQALPWYILITGLLFLVTRPLRRDNQTK